MPTWTVCGGQWLGLVGPVANAFHTVSQVCLCTPCIQAPGGTAAAAIPDFQGVHTRVVNQALTAVAANKAIEQV